MPFTGVAPDVVAVSSAAGSGVNGRRGVQMTLSFDTFLPSGVYIPVVFDVPGEEPGHPAQYDDFNLRSTTDLDFSTDLGDFTVPAGSAVVVDAAHAGRWELTLTSEVATNLTGTFGTIEFDLFPMVNGAAVYLPQRFLSWGSGANTQEWDVDYELQLGAVWYELAEGDVVWLLAKGTPDGNLTDAVLILGWLI